MLVIWFDRIIIEGLKYLLAAYFLFGYKFCKSRKKYYVLLYFMLIPIAEYLGLSLFWMLWGFWLVFFLFDITIKECVKGSVAIFFFISIVDLCLYVILIGFYPGKISLEYNFFKFFIDILGAFLWTLFSIKGTSIRKTFQGFWNSLSGKALILLFTCMIFSTFLLGGLHSYLYCIENKRLERLTLASGMIIVFLLIANIVRLFQSNVAQARAEEREIFYMEYVKLQKLHTERLINKNNDIRSLQHEIQRHLLIMLEYCKLGELNRVQAYLQELQDTYKRHSDFFFGNIIIDCLMNQTVYELRKQGDLILETDGAMPNDLYIADTDLSVLIGNALENAKEALKKVPLPQRFLRMEIRHYQNRVYIYIENSVKDENITFEHTSKKNVENHGYGICNIIKIVEKYSGTATWNIQDKRINKEEVSVVLVKIKLLLPSKERKSRLGH